MRDCLGQSPLAWVVRLATALRSSMPSSVASSGHDGRGVNLQVSLPPTAPTVADRCWRERRPTPVVPPMVRYSLHVHHTPS